MQTSTVSNKYSSFPIPAGTCKPWERALQSENSKAGSAWSWAGGDRKGLMVYVKFGWCTPAHHGTQSVGLTQNKHQLELRDMRGWKGALTWGSRESRDWCTYNKPEAILSMSSTPQHSPGFLEPPCLRKDLGLNFPHYTVPGLGRGYCFQLLIPWVLLHVCSQAWNTFHATCWAPFQKSSSNAFYLESKGKVAITILAAWILWLPTTWTFRAHTRTDTFTCTHLCTMHTLLHTHRQTPSHVYKCYTYALTHMCTHTCVCVAAQ